MQVKAFEAVLGGTGLEGLEKATTQALAKTIGPDIYGKDLAGLRIELAETDDTLVSEGDEDPTFRDGAKVALVRFA
jgi:hypothetical protein